ncbi:MAG: DNA topoisomerase 4 subunit A [Clostridia bacterium]|nr:DNA topoisomerase 4 subunit A [Clostridia bacterium]
MSKEVKKSNTGKKSQASSGAIIERPLDEVLHISMIPYSECVILDRALPRVEDGLKPVQRRILYDMMLLGLEPDKPFKKSARIVGDCLGKFHPHGDSSVYDAMVRMAQPHNMREILVHGHGNFGSNDGDSAAAMRYTEAKLAPLALELLRDLEKDTVKWSLNFDDTIKEPDMLPGRFPNLLVNGSSGIAVGLATNIPPHNLAEVIDGVVAYIDNPNIKLKQMMKHIKGPDFPTGATMTIEELEKAYETGKGKVIMTAKYHIEEGKNDKKNIVITELPYQVNKSKLLQNIAALSEEKEGVLNDIAEVRDESDRDGMRAVITIKKDGNLNAVLENLLKSTDMRCSFAINMVAIAGGKPRTLGLLDIISYYVEYQREIIYRRSKYDLEVAKERSHILEGLLIAIKNIDEVIKIIKKAVSPADAKMKLKEKFILSERQAQAILDMRLARLTSLEVNKITDELKQLKLLIEKLTAIVKSKTMQLQIVKEEILEIKRKYKNPRRTQILGVDEVVEIETVKVDVAVPMVLGLTAQGNIKYMDAKTFANANKDYKNGNSLAQVHTQILHVKSDSDILAITSLGYSIRFNVSDLKTCKYREKGTDPHEFFMELSVNEKIVGFIPAEFNEKEERNLLFFTRLGFVKKTNFSEYNTVKSYIQAVKVREDDELIGVEFDVEGHDMLYTTAMGQVLFATKDDIPVQGRVSGGVRGISLYDGDTLISAGLTSDEGEVVVITQNGVAKRVILAQIMKFPRYRKGVRLILLNSGDRVVFTTCVKEPAELVLVTNAESVGVNSEKVAIIPREKKGNPLKNVDKVLTGYKNIK